MSSLSVFPPPPVEGEITLCEFNAKLIAESSETAKLSKYVPATQVHGFLYAGFLIYSPLLLVTTLDCYQFLSTIWPSTVRRIALCIFICEFSLILLSCGVQGIIQLEFKTFCTIGGLHVTY